MSASEVVVLFFWLGVVELFHTIATAGHDRKPCSPVRARLSAWARWPLCTPGWWNVDQQPVNRPALKRNEARACATRARAVRACSRHACPAALSVVCMQWGVALAASRRR
eukprot:6191930-Pleurochrysis_carterae.AAC.2